MREATLVKCQKAQEMIDSGLNPTQAMKKLKMGINSYYNFLSELDKKPTKYKSDKKRSESLKTSKTNPLVLRVLSSDLCSEDKIVLCAGLI